MMETASREKTILDEALELTTGMRQREYGHPLTDFTKVTTMGKPIIDAMQRGDIHPALAHALYMIQVKIARLLETPFHHDSVVDGAGYFNTYDMICKKLNNIEKQCLSDTFSVEDYPEFEPPVGYRLGTGGYVNYNPHPSSGEPVKHRSVTSMHENGVEETRTYADI